MWCQLIVSFSILRKSQATNLYVCIEVALRGDAPMKRRDPTGPRGGTHRARGSNIPTPWYHQYQLTLDHTYAHCALSEPTLLYTAEGVLYPHVGGTVTLWAHIAKSVSTQSQQPV